MPTCRVEYTQQTRTHIHVKCRKRNIDYDQKQKTNALPEKTEPHLSSPASCSGACSITEVGRVGMPKWKAKTRRPVNDPSICSSSHHRLISHPYCTVPPCHFALLIESGTVPPKPCQLCFRLCNILCDSPSVQKTHSEMCRKPPSKDNSLFWVIPKPEPEHIAVIVRDYALYVEIRGSSRRMGSSPSRLIRGSVSLNSGSDSLKSFLGAAGKSVS